MVLSTLCPGSWPPSPGFAPWAILICIMSELTRYSVVTPKRPDATCLIAERIESPLGSGLKRSASSPPSPVLDLPPMRFIAIASVVCASREMEPNAFDPGGGAGEIFGDEVRLEANRVEYLRAAIGLVGRDAHLRHHLEQPFVDRLDVALDDLLVGNLLRQLVLDRYEGFEGEIGIDRLRSIAGKTCEMVHLAGFAGFKHQPDRGAQPLPDQVMMHGRAGKQRRNRDPFGAGAAVRQDHDVDSLAY